jgi:hypothetical protein
MSGPVRCGLPQLSSSARLHGAELVGSGLWLDDGGLSETGSVFVSRERDFSLPKTLNSAFPSFSISLVQRLMSSGVAAISAASAIHPKEYEPL